jgi:hypothetical protein
MLQVCRSIIAPLYQEAASKVVARIRSSLLLLMYTKRIAIFLKEEQIKMRRLSGKTGAPVAELVRGAIDTYLKRGGKLMRVALYGRLNTNE